MPAWADSRIISRIKVLTTAIDAHSKFESQVCLLKKLQQYQDDIALLPQPIQLFCCSGEDT